eukprot:Gb_25772 [translate_table: standard]
MAETLPPQLKISAASSIMARGAPVMESSCSTTMNDLPLTACANKPFLSHVLYRFPAFHPRTLFSVLSKGPTRKPKVVFLFTVASACLSSLEILPSFVWFPLTVIPALLPIPE